MNNKSQEIKATFYEETFELINNLSRELWNIDYSEQIKIYD